MPFVGIPFLPTNVPLTRVNPFSFDERNKRMLALKEEKIRRFIEAENKVTNRLVSWKYFRKWCIFGVSDCKRVLRQLVVIVDND